MSSLPSVSELNRVQMTVAWVIIGTSIFLGSRERINPLPLLSSGRVSQSNPMSSVNPALVHDQQEGVCGKTLLLKVLPREGSLQ